MSSDDVAGRTPEVKRQDHVVEPTDQRIQGTALLVHGVALGR